MTRRWLRCAPRSISPWVERADRPAGPTSVGLHQVTSSGASTCFHRSAWCMANAVRRSREAFHRLCHFGHRLELLQRAGLCIQRPRFIRMEQPGRGKIGHAPAAGVRTLQRIQTDPPRSFADQGAACGGVPWRRGRLLLEVIRLGDGALVLRSSSLRCSAMRASARDRNQEDCHASSLRSRRARPHRYRHCGVFAVAWVPLVLALLATVYAMSEVRMRHTWQVEASVPPVPADAAAIARG